jgi:hypothetical protein
MTLVSCGAVVALLTIVNGAYCQVADYTKGGALRVRIHADTAWVSSVRSILKHDTLIVTDELHGVSSTLTWLLGPDSARVLKSDGGDPPFRMTSPTRVVMAHWEVARMYRLSETGVDTPTYPYNRTNKFNFTSRIAGDTVWMNYDSGDTYRSVLRNDTLTVSARIGGRPRDETCVIKGDSAYWLDSTGKVVQSVRKDVVLVRRTIAAASSPP